MRGFQSGYGWVRKAHYGGSNPSPRSNLKINNYEID